MQPSFLSTLRCPYCGSALEPVFRLQEQTRPHSGPEEAIRFGILQCACSHYPVVEGIPILQHVEGLASVVNFIRAREGQQALLQALKVFRVKWALRSQWHRLKYHLDARRLLEREDLSFQDAVNLVRKPEVFSDYLFHRYANPSFLAAIGPLLLLSCLEDREPRPCSADFPVGPQVAGWKTGATGPIRVMDLACGAGHCSFLMRLLFPALSVLSVDHDFVSLYLTKRFLAPDATHICLDAEVPSPFADDYFDAVFCLDAFHYLHSKKAIVAELKRVVKPGALWLFPHLHNALQQNITAGIPLSPGQYLDCFGFLQPHLFDEATILRGLSQRHTLDLATQPSPGDLEQSENLTLIAGPRDLWRDHHLFPALFCRQRSRLMLNPIYSLQSRREDLECALTWPNKVMANECRGAEAVLPVTCRLNRSELRHFLKGDGAMDDAKFRELIAKFVLVPLPPNYGRDRVVPA